MKLALILFMIWAGIVSVFAIVVVIIDLVRGDRADRAVPAQAQQPQGHVSEEVAPAADEPERDAQVRR